MTVASWSVWALLAALAAVVNWVAVATGRPAVERWAKPLTMVGLIAVVLALGATESRTGWLLLAALVCCLLGDVALLADTQARFLLGLSAFLLGQLLYAVTFSSLGLTGGALWLLTGVLIVLAAFVVGREILPAVWRSGGATMITPVAVYMGVIGLMALFGWMTGHLLIGLGAAFFLASDTLLALDKFVEARPWGHLAVMVTYHVAQGLIALGVLRALV